MPEARGDFAGDAGGGEADAGGGIMNEAYNMDCLEYMRTLADESVDMVVTSPPYDDIRDYNGFSFDWKQTISELYRIIKRGGVAVWIVNDQTVDGSESGTSFRQALYAIECGFNLHDTMIWDKGAVTFPDSYRYLPCFEYMFVWSKGVPKVFNPIKDRPNIYAGKKAHGTFRQKDGSLKPKKHQQTFEDYGMRFNVWRIPGEKHNITGHPAVFPLGLAKDHIRTWSEEGDMVLDPFLGSGTSRIAAYDLRRDFIGTEISREYFEAQEKRFAEYTAQTRMF
jgi:site-specific DNA-methyltransferase (adenine-specific)